MDWGNKIKDKMKHVEEIMKNLGDKLGYCKVEDMKKEFIDIENCCGKVSGEYIYAYPPGIPIISIGEVFDEKAVNTIKYLIEKGVNVVSEGNKLPFKVCCAIDTR